MTTNEHRENWSGSLPRLLECSGHGIWQVSCESWHVTCSPAAAKLLGWKARESASALEVLADLRPAARTSVLEGLVEAAAAPDGCASIEYLLGSDEDERWVRSVVAAERDASGRIVRFTALVEDVTAREAARLAHEIARKEAEAASHIKSRFLANMSHEIRTPMNAVLGMTGLLLETPLDTEQREYLLAVRTSGEALLHLINDILDVSKIEAGKLELDAEVQRPSTVVHETVMALASRAHEKGVEVVLDIDPSAHAEVSMDPLRFRQVLTNIVGNAVKFTYAGEVVVSARYDSGTLIVQVKDSGIGIPESARAMIFEPFRQVDSETTREFGGTGLGLSIARQLTTLMGGTISVESEVGKGSFFELRLPLLLVQGPAPKDRVLAGRKVAIVCSTPALEVALVRTLDDQGAEVVVVSESRAALDLARRGTARFDFVIDQDLCGEISGLDLARLLHGAPNTRSATLLTRLTVRFSDEEQRLAGFPSVVRKPRLDLLTAAILEGAQPRKLRPSVEPAGSSRRSASGGGREPVADVLIAEDDDLNARLACALVKKHGLNPVRVRNGREAVERAASARFSLVLMDVQMPELDGLAATRLIREREAEQGGHLPIVAMTANAMRGDEERCLASGMDAYISKPVDRKKLDEVLERWCHAAHVEDARRTTAGGGG